MAMPCEKRDDIKDIKADVKEIKAMLTDALIDMATTKAEVSLHKKLWGGLSGIVIAVGIYLIQKQII
jgi:hypothetical protein